MRYIFFIEYFLYGTNVFLLLYKNIKKLDKGRNGCFGDKKTPIVKTGVIL